MSRLRVGITVAAVTVIEEIRNLLLVIIPITEATRLIMMQCFRDNEEAGTTFTEVVGTDSSTCLINRRSKRETKKNTLTPLSSPARITLCAIIMIDKSAAERPVNAGYYRIMVSSTCTIVIVPIISMWVDVELGGVVG